MNLTGEGRGVQLAGEKKGTSLAQSHKHEGYCVVSSSTCCLEPQHPDKSKG